MGELVNVVYNVVFGCLRRVGKYVRILEGSDRIGGGVEEYKGGESGNISVAADSLDSDEQESRTGR